MCIMYTGYTSYKGEKIFDGLIDCLFVILFICCCSLVSGAGDSPSFTLPQIEPSSAAQESGENDPLAKPKYCIIPRVQKTAVEITFNRQELEEFMDRLKFLAT